MNLESEIKCYIQINKVLKESIYRWNSVLLGYRPLLEVVNAKCPLLKREDCPTNLCPVYKKGQCYMGGIYSGILAYIETIDLGKHQTIDQVTYKQHGGSSCSEWDKDSVDEYLEVIRDAAELESCVFTLFHRINTMITFLKKCLQENESLCCLSLEKFLEEGGIIREKTVLDLTDEEMLNEVRAKGQDPDKIASKMDDIFKAALDRTRR